ncbi:hypothetical protein LOK49_LG01G00420 [Camellia lanceoleosa]|uniref:Uncharacterized protein n=1 Tax=Camellia lanceoleosa TaxID=1840588 RepID=A0ACC0J2G2_9ERIC|nr:hypothetical protein LOK49_LG01G00420 [Camellia lanceoleosa]
MIMQNSPNQQDPDQDQRHDDRMENSNTMTIDFLRARLLTERSVSRTSRQRADELAKRVLELEEQLKTVSLQRKKAEKTIAYAHAILENHGMSGFSDKFDLSSDHKVIHCESKVSNNSAEEEEEEEEGSLVGSKMRRNHTDEFSGSEPESSPLPRRSLSWKSGKDSSYSHEKKYTDSSTRSRSTFVSTTSASPRRRDGKCCRHIRRREARSAVEESQIDNSVLSPQESEIATCFDIKPEILRKSSEKQDAKVNLEGSVAGDLENQKSVASASNYMGEHGSDKDMERALEHQAQLIGQYEEEEKHKENGKRSSERTITVHRIFVNPGTTLISLKKEMRLMHTLLHTLLGLLPLKTKNQRPRWKKFVMISYSPWL